MYASLSCVCYPYVKMHRLLTACYCLFGTVMDFVFFKEVGILKQVSARRQQQIIHKHFFA